MSMQVGEDIYLYLRGLNLLSLSEGKRINDSYQIGKSSSQGIENGVMFGRVLRTLARLHAASVKRNEAPLPELDALKELNTPSAKLYNWNILQEAFKKIGVHLSPEQKGLIVTGNLDGTFAFLREIIQSSLGYIPEEVARTQSKTKTKPKVVEYKEEIDVSRVNIAKDLQKSNSCIEFFVILLSRHLSLPATQTASLFTHTNKYLAHLFGKGVKGLFDPITNFYQDVYQSVPQLLTFFKADPTKKNMHLTMNALKPGLVSKSFDVAQWTARLFSRLAFEFGDGNLLTASWDWFVSENGGLNTTLLGLKRHPELREQVVAILLQFARFNFIELFTIHMKRAQPDPRDLLNTYVLLLKPLTASAAVAEEFLSAGILDEWVDFAMETASEDYKNTQDIRIAALALLVEVWLLFPLKIEENEFKSNNILNLLNKGSREKQMPLVLSSLGFQFQLLIFFGNTKSQFAPSVYRSLTLCLIESHSNVEIREFIMNNFAIVFEELDTIPLNILVEPLVRQIQVTDGVTYFFNVFDFTFFAYISKNNRVQLKNAIQLLDLFFKIYLNTPIFAQLSSIPILNIIHKFIDSETLHEFVIKFIKVSLAMFYASEKKKRPKEKVLPLYNNRSKNGPSNVPASEIEAEIVAAQKRALIVEMIKSIIAINSADLNDKIKPLVAHTNIQIKQFSKANSKGMLAILMLFGQPEEILEKYEKEYNEHQLNLKDLKEKNNSEMLIESYEGMASHQSDIMKTLEENFEKYKKFSKAEAMHFALLRNPNTDPKILKNLQELKNNYQAMEEKKKADAAKAVADNQKQKENMRKQLMKRSLEQGVSSMNLKDMDGALLSPFGSREKQLKKEAATAIPIIQYVDLETEETRDKEMIEALMRKYQKVLKNIFVKYSNSGFSQQFAYKNLNSFDSIKEKSSVISVPEIYKFIKDYQLADLVTQEDHQSLVRLVGLEQAKKQKIQDALNNSNSSSLNGSSTAIRPASENEQIKSSQSQLLKSNISPLKNRSYVRGHQSSASMQLNQGMITPSSSKIYPTSTLASSSVTPKTPQPVKLYEKGQGQRNYGSDDPKDVKSIKFPGFQDYIVQFACFAYSKPPFDMKHLPLSSAVQKLFDHMRQITVDKGQSTVLFDESDSAYFGETDVIKEFNRQLEQDPEYMLPQGYKKIKDKDIRFDYGLDGNQLIPMGDSFRYAYEILNDLFKENLNFFLVEPKSVTKEVFKAIPLLGNPVEPEAQFMDVFKTPQTVESRKAAKLAEQKGMKGSQSVDLLAPWGKPDSTKSLVSSFNYKPKYGEKRVLEVEPLHKLDLGMKLAISTMSYKDRFTAEQVGFCLDDVIRAVENGEEQVIKNKKVENVIVQERKLNMSEQKLEQKKYEDRLKKNHQDIQTRAKEIEEETADKKRERKEKEDKEKKDKQDLEKRKKAGDEQFWREQKERFDEAKSKKDEEKQREKEEKEQKDQQEKQAKEKEASEFIRKQIGKQSEKFKEIIDTKKQSEEDKKQKESEQKNLVSRLHLQSIKTNQELVGQDKENNRKIKELLGSPEFLAVFKKNEFKLNQLFIHLRNFTYRELSRDNVEQSDISLKTFSWFCNKFNLFPGVLPQIQDIAMIFHAVTRNKQLTEFKPISANEEEFKEALLRIAVKGKAVFNKYAGKLAEGVELNQSEMRDIANEENNNNNQSKMKQVIDNYGNISEVTAQTFEALMYYLGLPEDKIGIGEALKNVIEQGAKPNNVLKKEINDRISKDPKDIIRYKLPQAEFSNISNIKVPKKQQENSKQEQEEVEEDQDEEGQDQEEEEQE